MEDSGKNSEFLLSELFKLTELRITATYWRGRNSRACDARFGRSTVDPAVWRQESAWGVHVLREYQKGVQRECDRDDLDESCGDPRWKGIFV